MQLLGVLACVEKHAVEKHTSGTSIVFASYLLLSNRNNHLQFIFSISLTSMKNQLHKFDMAEYTHEDLERDFAPLGEWDDKATKERIAQIVKEGNQSTPELVSTVFLTVFCMLIERCYYCLIRYCGVMNPSLELLEQRTVSAPPSLQQLQLYSFKFPLYALFLAGPPAILLLYFRLDFGVAATNERVDQSRRPCSIRHTRCNTAFNTY